MQGWATGPPDDPNLPLWQLYLFDARWKTRQVVEHPWFPSLFLALTIINTILLAMTYDGELWRRLRMTHSVAFCRRTWGPCGHLLPSVPQQS